MLNRITIMGRIGTDLELKRTQNGVPVVSFRIANDRDFKDSQGNRQSDWLDVVAWRTTAEFVCSNFTKGRMIAVDGKLSTRQWQDRDGNRRTAVEIVADSVYFADSKPKHEEPGDINAVMNRYNQPESGEYIESENGGELPF